ncbi:uncharacterized protein [Typha angustifolia]|uniref:uncharacterized protein isoform X2 n=1 Tax=Typha angustifolia TaxID=59011 RepID=UPI003C2BE25B
MDGNDLYFRINRSAQLRNLMNVYCKRQSLDFNSISFLLDGRKLHWDQTPDEVGMEDGNEIEVMSNSGIYHEEKHAEEYILNNTIPSSQVSPIQTQPQSPPSSHYIAAKKEETDGHIKAMRPLEENSPYSISRCITMFNNLQHSSDDDMLKAVEVFTKSKDNREIFVSLKESQKMVWLKKAMNKL